MHPRRALIVDKDVSFTDRVQRCLRVAGIAGDVVDSRRAALEHVVQTQPAILFLAVEQPKRSGFALFSDVKRLARQTPVVLATSTVPMSEMMLHQKLRIHADAYVDKRQLDEAAILEMLNRLLALELDDAELSRMARGASSAGRGAASGPPRSGGARVDDVGRGSTGPRLSALLEELGVDPPDLETAPESPQLAELDLPPEPAEEEPELREQVARLHRELEIARQAARSSPFSADYLSLAERADHGHRDGARLRRDLDARARQVEALRSNLVQLAARLVDAERAHTSASERIKGLEARLESSVDELGRARESVEAQERRASEEREREARAQAGALDALRREIVELQQRAVKAALEAEALHGDEMAALGRRHAETIERERERARLAEEQERQAAALGRQALEALASRDAEWQRRVEELQQEHVRAAERQREEHRRELNELHDSMEKALQRKDQQLAAELLSMSEEHEQRLARATGEWQARLAALEPRQREELDELGARHTAARERMHSEHAAYVAELTERLEREAARAREALGSEWRSKLDEVQREHARAVESLREEHRRETARLAASNEQALAEEARQHVEALTQAVAELRDERNREDGQRLAELEEAERRRRADLLELEQRYRDEIDLLRKLHEVELERLDVRHAAERERMQSERESALEELSHKLRAERDEVGPTGLDLPDPSPGRDEIRRAIEALDADPPL